MHLCTCWFHWPYHIYIYGCQHWPLGDSTDYFYFPPPCSLHPLITLLFCCSPKDSLVHSRSLPFSLPSVCAPISTSVSCGAPCQRQDTQSTQSSLYCIVPISVEQMYQLREVDNENLQLRREEGSETREHDRKQRRCLSNMKKYSFPKSSMNIWNWLREDVIEAGETGLPYSSSGHICCN